MTPLKIVADIPAMIGEKNLVLSSARAAMACAPSAATPTAEKKRAVNAIIAAILSILRDPLEKRIDAHIEALEEEYILLEGYWDGDKPTPEWNAGLDDAIFASLKELEFIGPEKLKDWVYGDKPTSELVELLLANAISDVSNAFGKLGITPADIESVIPAAQPDEDAFDYQSERWPTPNARTLKASPETLFQEVRGVLAERNDGSLERFDQTKEGPPRKRKRSASVEGPTTMTAAAQACLIALQKHSGWKDADVAKELGVSRASIIGYREGKTLLNPDENQIAALGTMLDASIGALTEPWEQLNKASLG